MAKKIIEFKDIENNTYNVRNEKLTLENEFENTLRLGAEKSRKYLKKWIEFKDELINLAYQIPTNLAGFLEKLNIQPLCLEPVYDWVAYSDERLIQVVKNEGISVLSYKTADGYDNLVKVRVMEFSPEERRWEAAISVYRHKPGTNIVERLDKRGNWRPLLKNTNTQEN